MSVQIIVLIVGFLVALFGTWTDTKTNQKAGVTVTILLAIVLGVSIYMEITNYKEKLKKAEITTEIDDLYFKGYHEFILKKLEKDDEERKNAIAKSQTADEEFNKIKAQSNISEKFAKVELRYYYRYFENNYPLSRKLNNLNFKLLRFEETNLQGREVDYIQYGCEVHPDVVSAVYYLLISGGRKIRSIQQKLCEGVDKYRISISSDNQANLERECDPIEFDNIEKAIQEAKRSLTTEEIKIIEKAIKKAKRSLTTEEIDQIIDKFGKAKRSLTKKELLNKEKINEIRNKIIDETIKDIKKAEAKSSLTTEELDKITKYQLIERLCLLRKNVKTGNTLGSYR